MQRICAVPIRLPLDTRTCVCARSVCVCARSALSVRVCVRSPENTRPPLDDPGHPVCLCGVLCVSLSRLCVCSCCVCALCTVSFSYTYPSTTRVTLCVSGVCVTPRTFVGRLSQHNQRSVDLVLWCGPRPSEVLVPVLFYYH
jgi:hypothetical protein